MFYRLNVLALPKPKEPEPEPEPEPAVEPEETPEAKKPAQEPPKFIEVYEEMTVEEKSTMELRVKVTGLPEPEIKWYRDGKIMAATLKVKITKEAEGIHKLTINNVSDKQAGIYKCVATNKAGKANHQAKITVTGRP